MDNDEFSLIAHEEVNSTCWNWFVMHKQSMEVRVREGGTEFDIRSFDQSSFEQCVRLK